MRQVPCHTDYCLGIKKTPRAFVREEDNQIYYFYVLRVTLNSGLLHGANQAHGAPVAAIHAVICPQ